MSVVPRSAFEIAADLLYPQPHPYVGDPLSWVSEVLNEFLWSKQREIADALVKHRYVAVKSCHGSGKSHSSSRFVSWWLSTREDPFARTTAPTSKQVHAILWRYIGQAHRKGNLQGRVTLNDEWYMGSTDKELVACGRTPADYEQAAFQGIHALNPLIVIDEAGGVPRSIFDAVDSLATNARSRVLAIGNPDDPTSHFAEICKPGSGWHVVTISAFDTPAFTGEVVPEKLLELLVSQEWVEERKLRWGENSPIYVSKVLGQFPDINDDTLIQPKYIREAQEGTIEPSGQPVLGADIARYGADETTLYLSRGGHVRLHKALQQSDTMATVGHILKSKREIDQAPGANGFVNIVIDEVGVGAGPYDRLRELNSPVTGFNGGSAPRDKERFANARAEQYWQLREDFESGLIDLDPNDDQLAAQLGSIKWKVNSSGKILIESKDDMRKRGLPSPDRADGVMYSRLKGVNIEEFIETHVDAPEDGALGVDVMSINW